MSNRTAVVAFAALTGCVSIFITGSSLWAAPATSESAASAADECLAAPKATTPAGAHWYYRVEKGTKRKCWYLADEGGKTKKAAAPATPTSDTAEQDAPPPATITPPAKQDAPKRSLQKSVANARAELTSGTDDDPSLAETTWPPMPSPSAATDVRSDNQMAAVQPAPEPATKQGWNVATRWPEPTAVASASDQPTAAPAPQPVQPAPALTAERLATAAATPSAATQPVAATSTATTQPPQSTMPADNEGMSLRIMLSVLVCMLALVAILGPMLFKYSRPKPREDERTYGQRRPIWDMNVPNETIMQDNPHRMPAPRYARVLDEPRMMDEPRVLDDAADEIEELLARASKRSAA
jgi:hypothetical protein